MLMKVYRKLLTEFGYQGWWPLLECKGCNPTKSGCMRGYHPGDYSFPKNRRQIFEVCVGAILAQNTSWTNVEKSLLKMKEYGLLDAQVIASSSIATIKRAIKQSGYYNQKARKLKIFSEFFLSLGSRAPFRDELLGVWGIGPETTDSILLYAYHKPVFVVDAYTKRLLERLGFDKKGYGEEQEFFQKNVPQDHKIYNEFHALIVELAKRNCRKVPICYNCPLEKICKKVKN